MKRKIKAGTTSHIEQIVVDDSSSTTGAGLGSLVFNTASLAAKYKRVGDSSWTTITLVTATAGTWTTGGFVASDSGAGGGYELHIPNAALASGAETVWVEVYGATNMAPVRLEFELDAIDYQDGVRGGLTALPNAAADAIGGLVISDAGGLDIDAKLANTNEVTAARMGALTDWINGGRLDLLLDAIPTTAMRGTDGAYTGTPPTAAAVADAVWDELQSAHVTVGSFGIIASEIAAIPTTAMRGTDSAALASVATEARLAELDAANLPADIAAIPTTAMRGTDSAYTGTPPTAAAVADAVWDEVITTSAHNLANSAGKRLRQSTGLLQAESAVDDPGAAATTTAFDTDLTEVDNFWNDSLIVFTSGALAGQAKPILSYTQASGAIVLDEALTSSPSDNDEFTMYSTHIHSVSQIADGVWDEATAGHVGVGSTGKALTDTPTAAEIMAAGDVDGFTLEEAMKLCLAGLAGKLAGAAGLSITIQAADDSKTRITATVDSSGNRSAVTLDAAG